ncbi:hypothetical protein ACFT8P_13950 [Streptomyces sp. NPDC057101]|uniref:hypothetical protein n=1 Tax=Streptomyces sp. NPDC057101 TaxID=3346020 RepID=UPI00362A1501
MDTQTTQQNTVLPHPEQGTHTFVLTLDVIGRAAITSEGTITPRPGATRYDTYRDIKAQVIQAYPELTRGIVAFFSLEPNTL